MSTRPSFSLPSYVFGRMQQRLTVDLTAAERLALMRDRRCMDRHAAEFLSQREREWLHFMAWLKSRGRLYG
jgi:hypothetical protein